MKKIEDINFFSHKWLMLILFFIPVLGLLVFYLNDKWGWAIKNIHKPCLLDYGAPFLTFMIMYHCFLAVTTVFIIIGQILHLFIWWC